MTTAQSSFRQVSYSVKDYNLGMTLSSGQAFRWQHRRSAWEGVIGQRWVRLSQQTPDADVIDAVFLDEREDDQWLRHYLQIDADVVTAIATFPRDDVMKKAVAACTGLRLLRQDPWECLASFILSSTKQIVQIQQIVALVCERFGKRVETPNDVQVAHGFPSIDTIARLDECDLRACKMGFRAPYLLNTARLLASGEVQLELLRSLSCDKARQQLMLLPGVGRKIADCVLLFAYGFPEAFPVDVWIARALQQLYFPKRKKTLKQMQEFSATFFGPHGGYAQQYLFHYMRIAQNSGRTGKK